MGPINWNTLTADEAEAEWLDLNVWVHWLRGTYGLAPNDIPPLGHRHDEFVWELSALHLHWLNSYSPDASPSSPLAWHRDFTDARHRLRNWVAACGTRLDRDRPARQTTLPIADVSHLSLTHRGGPPPPPQGDRRAVLRVLGSVHALRRQRS